MRRPALGTLAFLTAAAAGLVTASPAYAAQAHPPAASGHAAVSVRPDGEIFWFTGDTYPDTAAGLAACNAEGAYERAHGVATWSCWLGNPNAGVYNLWLGQIIAE